MKNDDLQAKPFSLSCPMPMDRRDQVLLAHGEGARLSRRLVHDLLLKAFDNRFLRPLGDAAVLPQLNGSLVVTTDGYVVTPLFFPGGDIGQLAVHGAINDLAVSGALPHYLCLGLVVEEGLPLDVLTAVIDSVRTAATACSTPIVAGDTKVVPRGAADKLFVTTTGIGVLRPNVDLGMHRISPGDVVLVSGSLGDHGIAVLSAREQIDLGKAVRSDTASVFDLIHAVYESGLAPHFMRDPTRGGVSAALHEVADATGFSVVLEESSLPISAPVRGACELLGLDPLFIANEGKVLMICSPSEANAVLTIWRSMGAGQNSAVIGQVTEEQSAQVLVRGSLGVLRVLDEPAGAPLPRIC